MQIQPNLFAPSTANTAGISSSNVKRSQVEPTHQVEQSKKSQGIEVSQQVTLGQTDDESSQQHALSAPPQNPAPEELESRLGAKLEYEQQTQGGDGAVAHYLENQHAAQREAIQQMVGIDTYA
ncbi:hypothetical protein [Shewanella canadensis]|uniref:hypothetical protein n=1 Tax=Shewanella canadensis TaxID=271096 RepID=UPI001FEC7AE8|nr:hypothetical protein [Shewanella canadensis]